MADDELRSARFRREREASWRRLEELLGRERTGTLNALSATERREIPSLYRSALSSLAVARAIALDRSMTRYLEGLSSRAYFAIYGPRKTLRAVLSVLVRSELPRAARQSASMLLIAIGAFVLGALTGWHLVTQHPETFFGIVPTELLQGRSPFTATASLRDSLYAASAPGDDRLKALTMHLYVNNASIAILAFALGFALGIPTLCLLFFNGAVLGAFFAVFDGHGLAPHFVAWLWVHGTTEITAIILAGAAGLTLGRAVLFPAERQTRLSSLSTQGRQATVLAVGAMGMLVIAALLEGLVRQWVGHPVLRLAIGTAMAAWWWFYFTRFGSDVR